MDEPAATGNGRNPERPAAVGPPGLTRWTLLCAGAEAVGMTAAVSAAVLIATLFGEPSGGSQITVAVALVLAGGLVEGVALGTAQGAALRRWLPGVLWPWAAVTVLIAGLGWAAGSVPAVLSGEGGETEPPVLAVAGGALVLGALMGALLGAAQALVLRGQVAHPWRWAGASALAWAAAMPVIFLGAALAPPDTPAAALILLGTATGAVAGAVLGLVSGWFLPLLDARPTRLGTGARRAGHRRG